MKASDIELICIIVNFGQGSKILHTAKSCGINGGTVLLGKGTANNKLLDFLGLSDIRKEIVLMVGEKNLAEETLKKLDGEFKFEKPNHGIAFTTSVSTTLGIRSCEGKDIHKNGGKTMYHVITVVVDNGKAEYVIEAAEKAGSKGGTIIKGRGAGMHETSKLFSMDIEPEKEIVIILSETEQTNDIVESIRQEMKIDEPGKGIVFVQDVNETYGLYK